MTSAIDRHKLESLADEIDRFVEEHKERLFGLCRDLVAARSANPPGRTVEAAAVIEAFLNENGIVCETLAKVSEKPNLIARIEGGDAGRHLVFNGHLDTVSPGREADWSVPLYEMQSIDGKLTGLGMGNMKAGAAALALAFVWLARSTERWSGKVSYTAVSDETVFGPDGAGWLLAQRPDITGDAVICGEGPGDMNLALAEKGLLWVKLTAAAPSGQGMLVRPAASAITLLARAITEIDNWNDEQVPPPAELAVIAPYAGTEGLRLSINTGTVKGGQFVSQIATEATAEIDFRIPPGLSTEDIGSRLDDLCARYQRLTWERIKGWEPNWTGPNETIVETVAQSAQILKNKPANPVVRLPASDASRWRALGVPAVCFGPQPTLASGVDDFAWADDILMCTKIYCLSALLYMNAGG